MENIIWIIKNGQLDELEKLNFNCNVVLDTKGQCPLHIAADFKQIDVIKYLINKGADVNKTNHRVATGQAKSGQVMLSQFFWKKWKKSG